MESKGFDLFWEQDMSGRAFKRHLKDGLLKCVSPHLHRQGQTVYAYKKQINSLWVYTYIRMWRVYFSSAKIRGFYVSSKYLGQNLTSLGQNVIFGLYFTQIYTKKEDFTPLCDQKSQFTQSLFFQLFCYILPQRYSQWALFYRKNCKKKINKPWQPATKQDISHTQLRTEQPIVRGRKSVSLKQFRNRKE